MKLPSALASLALSLPTLLAVHGCDNKQPTPTGVMLEDFEETDDAQISAAACPFEARCVPDARDTLCSAELQVHSSERCPQIDCDADASPDNGMICAGHSDGAPEGTPGRALALAFDVGQAVGDDSYAAYTEPIRGDWLGQLSDKWNPYYLAFWAKSSEPNTKLQVALAASGETETWDGERPILELSTEWRREQIKLENLLYGALPSGEPQDMCLGDLAGIRFAFPRWSLLEDTAEGEPLPALSGVVYIDDIVLEPDQFE